MKKLMFEISPIIIGCILAHMGCPIWIFPVIFVLYLITLPFVMIGYMYSCREIEKPVRKPEIRKIEIDSPEYLSKYMPH